MKFRTMIVKEIQETELIILVRAPEIITEIHHEILIERKNEVKKRKKELEMIK